jgi:hypothetical protein
LAWLDAEVDNAFAASRRAADARLDEIAWKLPAVLFGPYAERYPIRSWITDGEKAAPRTPPHQRAELSAILCASGNNRIGGKGLGSCPPCRLSGAGCGTVSSPSGSTALT